MNVAPCAEGPTPNEEMSTLQRHTQHVQHLSLATNTEQQILKLGVTMRIARNQLICLDIYWKHLYPTLTHADSNTQIFQTD